MTLRVTGHNSLSTFVAGYIQGAKERRIYYKTYMGPNYESLGELQPLIVAKYSNEFGYNGVILSHEGRVWVFRI